MKLAGSQQVIAEVTRPSTGYEVRAFNADKSVMYTEENPFVINFDGTDILVLEANEDWALKSNPEWMEFNRRASDSEVVSGNAGDNVSVTPQMIMQYKKNEITGFLTIESRSGAVAKVPVKYEGSPADRIIGTLKDNIEVSVDGESYIAGDNSYINIPFFIIIYPKPTIKGIHYCIRIFKLPCHLIPFCHIFHT